MYGLGGAVLPPMLRISTRTWMRDSHDLFDYETQEQVTLRQFATSGGLRLLRSEEHVSALSSNSDVSIDKPFDHLLNIYCKRTGEYVVAPAEKVIGSVLHPQKLWTIVRALPNARYALQEGDVIKLGRFRLRVKQLVPKLTDDDSVTDGSLLKLYDTNIPQVYTPKEEQMQCRICLSEDISIEDRLICACECKGSIKYVHVACLQKWINSKWDVRDTGQTPQMVFIREVNCELCKARFPCYIRYNDEVIQIVKFPQMMAPFVVLENCTPHVVRGVHLLSLHNVKDLKLGRGHESDVRIPDVSISRFHATLCYNDGIFYIVDHDSKFGTLVAMRRPRTICPGEPVILQVGRSVVEMVMDHTLPYVPGCIEIPPIPPTYLGYPENPSDPGMQLYLRNQLLSQLQATYSPRQNRNYSTEAQQPLYLPDVAFTSGDVLVNQRQQFDLGMEIDGTVRSYFTTLFNQQWTCVNESTQPPLVPEAPTPLPQGRSSVLVTKQNDSGSSGATPAHEDTQDDDCSATSVAHTSVL
ncbi:bifunctional Forkhead-associated (FHA) domain/Zinc finger [Babesia duncani]|uniref:Bifunctional Forkhead-associated (FHA) domain/Zinc finger n=1 Tax=Babesia duncani TaxID=323732 RepID=A0AAD9PM65_9APIC|nr:bifunctional Forkhead-associated (FHA) domain/Zinc finger [Babesia duncani]